MRASCKAVTPSEAWGGQNGQADPCSPPLTHAPTTAGAGPAWSMCVSCKTCLPKHARAGAGVGSEARARALAPVPEVRCSCQMLAPCGSCQQSREPPATEACVAPHRGTTWTGSPSTPSQDSPLTPSNPARPLCGPSLPSLHSQDLPPWEHNPSPMHDLARPPKTPVSHQMDTRAF